MIASASPPPTDKYQCVRALKMIIVTLLMITFRCHTQLIMDANILILSLSLLFKHKHLETQTLGACCDPSTF